MNGLKNFFYKNNDIIIVLLILIVAAFVIYTRVTIIMDYPDRTAVQNPLKTIQELVAPDTPEETK